MADPLAWLDDPAPPKPASKVHARATAVDPLAFLDTAPPEPVRVVDAGPAARGASPSRPRDLTDEEAGTLSGPITTTTNRILPGVTGARTQQDVGTAPQVAPEEVTVAARHPGTGQGVAGAFGPPKTLIVRPPQGEMTDPLVQMGTAGALGAGAGGIATRLGAGALDAAAVEGAVANKSLGGDASTGAVLALVPHAGAVARAGARTVQETARAGRNALQEAAGRAQGRVNAAASKAVTGENVAALAPTEHARLSDTFGRHDDLRRALYDAKGDPEKAHTAVSTTLTKANARIDNEIGEITARGRVDEMLADYDALADANKGDVAKTSAIKAQRDAVASTFGKSREATAGELRRLTQSVGRGPYAASLYGPIARQLERVAKASDGIDVGAFMEANRDVATLTPYVQSLNERAVAGRMGRTRGLVEHVKAMVPTAGVAAGAHFGLGMDPATLATIGGSAYAATKIGAAVARRVDYKLAQLVDMARKGPLPRAALEDAAKVGVPPALLLQLGQRAGVHEGGPANATP